MYLKQQEYEYLKTIATGDTPVHYPTLLKVLATIEDRQQKANNKTWEQIKNKRQINPDYARPEKEHRRNSNPTPRDVWYGLYHNARYSRGKHETERREYLNLYCQCIEVKYNIDSDYLMETMGKYALSIT